MRPKYLSARFIARAGPALLLLAVLAGAPALADDSDVLQVKQSFDPNAMDVSVGAVVNFINADDVNHNIQTIGPDGAKVDQGLQKPGETTAVTFASAGVYSVICAIHPRMKMKVTVR